MTSIAPTLQGFFTQRLISQRRVSSRTIASYRDSLKLLLAFAQQRTGKKPSTLDWADLDAELITAFLEHLETGRHNTTRTRNLRLTAIRSLFTYAALRHPEHAALIQQVLAIPAKRSGKQLISFLTQAEIDALLAACDLSRWEGRRDRALLLVAAQTGLRVSELTGRPPRPDRLRRRGHRQDHRHQAARPADQLRVRARFPAGAGRIPVVYVTCPPKGSPRKLAMEFARFLGLPLRTRANVTDIADAVCQVLIDARTDLVLVDFTDRYHSCS